MKKYNLSKIMKRAWEFVKKLGISISEGLRAAWKEAKEMVNVVLKHFESYNHRRYSTPWVCVMVNGKYDFSKKIGTYTADKGDAGDLIVYNPTLNQVYGYGQKDYRGSNTEKSFVKWNGSKFVECDRFGK